jgi:glucose/arabinose dehydrogenase
VVEQPGRIRILSRSPGTSAYGTFLDLSSRVTQSGGEEGLLGLAFDPGYATNGELYVSYVAAGSTPRTSVIARYRRNTSDPTRADTTEERLLTLSQPYTNHHGGMIAFGPDGYLYAGFGDGGSGGDPQNNGLDRGTLLGKILRIDVHGTQAGLSYRIPSDNPFVGVAGVRGEIWAYGLRNPWRFSFDRVGGALWAGDVGQGTREEIDVVTRGANYGWRAREGFVAFNAADAGRGPFTDPLFDYARGSGACVIGGYVYRGSALPALVGSYVYGDNSSGAGPVRLRHRHNRRSPPVGLSSFGEDADAAARLRHRADASGKRRRGARGDPFPQTLSATGIFRDVARQAARARRRALRRNVAFW